MPGTFHTIAHTADTGIEAEARTFPELVETLSAGMFSLMFELGELLPATHSRVAVSAHDNAETVVRVLSELLAWSEVEQLVPCYFVARRRGSETEMDIGAAPLHSATLVGPAIKAVTYHDLSVTFSGDGWRARVIFDV